MSQDANIKESPAPGPLPQAACPRSWHLSGRNAPIWAPRCVCLPQSRATPLRSRTAGPCDASPASWKSSMGLNEFAPLLGEGLMMKQLPGRTAAVGAFVRARGSWLSASSLRFPLGSAPKTCAFPSSAPCLAVACVLP